MCIEQNRTSNRDDIPNGESYGHLPVASGRFVGSRKKDRWAGADDGALRAKAVKDLAKAGTIEGDPVIDVPRQFDIDRVVVEVCERHSRLEGVIM